MSADAPVAVPPRSRRNLYLSLVLLLAGVGVLAYFLLRHHKESKQARTQEQKTSDTPETPTVTVRPFRTAVPDLASLKDVKYIWTPKTVYRFNYQKTITMLASAQNLREAPAVRQFSGYLVLDVDTVATDGTASAQMRLDTPKVTLPSYAGYNIETGLKEDDPQRGLYTAQALEYFQREVRWKVQLSPYGHILIESRVPSDWKEWYKKFSTATKLRKNLEQPLLETLKSEMGNGPGGSADEELLASLTNPQSGPDQPRLSALHPVRHLDEAKPAEQQRIELLWTRQVPVQDGAALEMHFMNSEDEPVRMSLDEVKQISGHAYFDNAIGMLDRLEEKYRAVLQTEMKGLVEKHEVEFEYHLDRIAPAIRGATDVPPEEL